jgi:hypothetical protein
VEDHERRVLRRLGGERVQGVGGQVACLDARRVLPRDGDRLAQRLHPVLHPGPDQQLQPVQLVLVVDVDGVEVEPGAPGDLG